MSLRNWSGAKVAGGERNIVGSGPRGFVSHGKEPLFSPKCHRKLLKGSKQKSGDLTRVFKRFLWLLCRVYHEGSRQDLLKLQMHTLTKMQNIQVGREEFMWLRPRWRHLRGMRKK